MTQADTKTPFSVHDANRTLPLVRSIVTDIVSEYRRMREIGRERRAIEVGASTGGTPGDAGPRRLMDDLKVELEERSARIDGYIKELADLGVELKDPEKGLVDFPSERGGRAVWLCWHVGEERVTHWHGVDETYFDRRPLETGTKRASGEKRAGGDEIA
jgi:hypothetical protein